MSVWTDPEEKKLAKDIKEGDRIEWVGSFGVYTALSDAVPDPTFPGRVKFQAERTQKMGVRLRADQEVEVWPDWTQKRDIEYPVEVQGIQFEGHPFREDRKTGKLVKVRVANKKPEEQGTHLGIYLGDAALGMGAYFSEEGILKFVVGRYNPAMWVPALNRIVYGCGSWWGLIESEEDLRKITDDDIQNVWYVKLAKQLSDQISSKKPEEPDAKGE